MIIKKINKNKGTTTVSLSSSELVKLSNVLYHAEKEDKNELYYKLYQQIMIARDLSQYGHIDVFCLERINQCSDAFTQNSGKSSRKKELNIKRRTMDNVQSMSCTEIIEWIQNHLQNGTSYLHKDKIKWDELPNGKWANPIELDGRILTDPREKAQYQIIEVRVKDEMIQDTDIITAANFIYGRIQALSEM